MKTIQTIFLLFIHLVITAQKTVTFELGKEFESNDLIGYVYRYDSEKRDSAQYVVQNAYFNHQNEIPSFRADKHYHWFKINLKSSSKKQLVLDYQQIFIDDLDFFLFDNDSLIQQYHSSWELDFSEKSFPSRYHSFAFEVDANKIYTVLLRCHNSKIAYSNRVFLELFDRNIFEKSEDFFLLQISLSVGSLLFVMFLSIGFYVSTNKRIYLYYALYITAISLYLLDVNGIINQFFNPKFSFLTKPEFGSFLVIANLFFHSLYLFEYFKIAHYNRQWLKNVFIAYFVLCAIYFIFNILQIYKSIPFAYFYLSFTFLVVVTLITNFHAQRKAVYLYLAASGPPLLTFLFVILGAIGLVKINTIFFYYAHIPMALEGIGLGLALLYLYNDARKKIEEELEKNRIETTQKILFAQEEERRKLSLDLHDDLGGSLSVLNRELNEFNERNAHILNESVNLTKKIVQDLRMISHHLMPSSFEEKGLVNVVKESIEMSNRQSGVHFLFVCNGNIRRLNLDTEINIYRIIKESINNVLKHSEAQQSVIQLIYFEEFLYVSIEDDGKGFSFSNQEYWGIGLKNLNLRTQYLQAELQIESSIAGTLIRIEIPYNGHENKNFIG